MLEIKNKRKKVNLLNYKLIRVQVKIKARILTRLLQDKTIIKGAVQLQLDLIKNRQYKIVRIIKTKIKQYHHLQKLSQSKLNQVIYNKLKD